MRGADHDEPAAVRHQVAVPVDLLSEVRLIEELLRRRGNRERKAWELAERLPHRVDQARVRYWYARMLIDRDDPGDRNRAEQMLRDARSMSESIGMRGHVELIDAVMDDARQGHGSA